MDDDRNGWLERVMDIRPDGKHDDDIYDLQMNSL